MKASSRKTGVRSVAAHPGGLLHSPGQVLCQQPANARRLGLWLCCVHTDTGNSRVVWPSSSGRSSQFNRKALPILRDTRHPPEFLYFTSSLARDEGDLNVRLFAPAALWALVFITTGAVTTEGGREHQGFTTGGPCGSCI